MKVLTGNWESLKEQAAPIRQTVFVQEQKVPKELEYDDQDHQCLHVVVLDDAGQAVGTGRLLPDGHIGRVAVLSDFRGQGVGGRIMSALIDEARRKGHEEVVIHAQISAEPFYMMLGFEPDSDVFMEAGIAHRVMRKVLVDAQQKEWNVAFAGKKILVVLTHVDLFGDTTEQIAFHGSIARIADGMLFVERADGQGETSVPFNGKLESAVANAVYTIRTTGEEVEGLDYISSWTIRPQAVDEMTKV